MLIAMGIGGDEGRCMSGIVIGTRGAGGAFALGCGSLPSVCSAVRGDIEPCFLHLETTKSEVASAV